ncbi:hypothetical protein CspHIS471_0608280 [Cutaneotrichosporon sp. HIS471]|nr:hypothetical protein CspHIS471_0608280 [Cutaneotrichosporon sp. HIS471]
MSDSEGPAKRPRTEEDSMNDARGSRGPNTRGKFQGRGGRGKSYGQRGGGYKGQNRGERMKDKGRDRGRFPTKPAKKEMNEEDMMNAETETIKKEEVEDGEPKEKRLPKKRAAVLVGYCGTGYHGMQIQPHDPLTIEGDIFAALAKAGAVSPENAVDHKKVDVQRSARTDAGVHAAGNCISLKMILDPPVPPEFPNLTAYVNSFLPAQIRMWGFVRAMKSFQARTACDSRVYEYLLPSYCLLPPASSDPFAKVLDETSPGWRDIVKSGLEFVDAAPPMEEPAEGEDYDPKQRGEFERRRGWRVDEDTLKRFDDLIQQYKGTHNFHNYTVYKPFNDVSVKRYMIRLDVRPPAVYGEIEWISVQIHGQSFMLHQIRKMISMAILACRSGTPPSLLPETFGPKRIHIPKAPPLGLLLEQPQFKVYNERTRSIPNPDGEPRELVDFKKHADEMHAFKVKWIYDALRQTELETNTYHKWLKQIDHGSSRDFTYLNTRGVIPDEALQNLTSKKYGGPGGQPNKRERAGEEGEGEGEEEEVDELDDSDDEDKAIDRKALQKGEFDS